MSFGFSIYKWFCIFHLILWNSGLRETAVTDAFLFLSTFFIQSARHIVSLRIGPVNMFMHTFLTFFCSVYKYVFL